MRKHALLLLVLLFPILSIAQSIDSVSQTSAANGGIDLHIYTTNGYSFSFTTSNISYSNDTIHVDACYTSGFLPVISNDYTVINLNPSAGINSYNIIVLNIYGTDANGQCDYQSNQDSETMPVTVTGITEVMLSKTINIYPNPSSSKIRIDLPEHLQIIDISIIDMEGKLVRKYGHSQLELDINEFADGNYLLHIETDKGVAMKKILISEK